MATRPDLIVIVGPTASGKSDLAMRIAGDFNGEIICADSRTIYKGMDIGTAKPSTLDQQAIPHWGLDLIEPGEVFSAKQFKDYALTTIRDIKSRDKLPIMVGGTGLYVDSVIFDFQFKPVADPLVRKKLEAMDVSELQSEINKLGYEMPGNSLNKRHLVRAIETEGLSGGRRKTPIEGALIVGLSPDPSVLEAKIKNRAETFFDKGILEETKKLIGRYGEDKIRRTGGLIYAFCLDIINDSLSPEKAQELSKIADRQYAKRQQTWFKRNPYILWNSDTDSAYRTTKSHLNN